MAHLLLIDDDAVFVPEQVRAAFPAPAAPAAPPPTPVSVSRTSALFAHAWDIATGQLAGYVLRLNPVLGTATLVYDVGGTAVTLAQAPAASLRRDGASNQVTIAAEGPRLRVAVNGTPTLEVQDDRNPDLENLLGYAYRHIGRFNEGFRHYEIALRLNPRHRGAHEYIGEAFLMVSNPAKAAEHLAALKEICVSPGSSG
jgi:tetratricopeptide (TPR) repeat protein